MRGLRKILKLPTTYVDRRFSNARVYEIATHAQYSDKIDKRVRPISEELDEKRIRLTGHIIRSDDTDPLRQVSYQPGRAAPVDIGKRRVGRPRQQWLYHSTSLVHIASSGILITMDTISKMKLYCKQRSSDNFKPSAEASL